MQLNTRYKENFKDRHIGASADEVNEMLKVVGVSSLDELIEQTLPKSIILDHELNTSARVSEQQFLNDLKEIASKNKIFKSYIGMGYYNTFTPGVILRNIMENPGWYTQYTPYQAEIAQGRLEALLNFQTTIIDLTGMEIANASLLDEATAAAEAMHMFYGLKGKDQGERFFISELTFPQTIDVFKTRAEAIGIDLVVGNYEEIELNNEYFGAYIQYPDNNGNINIYKEFCDDAHSVGVKVAVGADLMSLVLLAPPAEFGADAVVGTTQRFGVPLGYGGPHAAYFATKEEYKRQLPGRIIGVSIDRNGNRALRMALQTREQHIRREKATSNICTAQVLLAIMAGAYATYHGPEGLKKIAGRIHGLTKVLDKGITQMGYRQINTAYFDTIKIDAEGLSTEIRSLSEALKINFRYFNDNKIGISIDETTSPEDVQVILDIFAQAKGVDTINIETLEEGLTINWDKPFIRKSAFLTHEVFNKYHSEHEMLRYLKHLENKDLSLAHSMISLGSCTMKLNATTEMIPVTWPEFNQLHPFVPLNQAEGYLQMFEELERDLAEITGFSGTSLQPNAGAQGEYTGLLVIRKYFESLGQSHRNVAIIPQSAHGTNPASAVMAGMKVVVVKTDEKGNIDIDDLKVKAEQHAENLACLMITYPSTHGVFEEGVKDMTAIIHENGGQVYMDGANMNAQVGITNPGMIGADVCHLNLHKTFCIPHGGGGPGMGPICVAKHLVPFLPGHSLVKTGGYNAIPPVSAAPWGSASILVISYAYIKMMGTKGLTEATKTAILNANYMKARLSEHFKTLYEGKNGRVAHEMIVDTRVFKNTAGVEVEDIAKRLIDYGFHAPTVSFPVAGTLMIEPTESESKEELDKFCDALISIKGEIDEIISGKADKDDNVLKNAPHTVIEVTADTWEHKYSRQQAAYPAKWVAANKFWPSVARVNNTHGDRNLICSCPPLEAYEEVVA